MGSGHHPRTSVVPTARDLQLLYGLWQARYATTPQLAALYWRGGPVSTLRAAQRRLKQLAAVSLLRRVEPWIKKSLGGRPYIYTLGEQAPGLLCQAFGLELATIDWRPKTTLENNFLFMDHLLATNDVQIALTLASEQQGCQVTWTGEHLLKRKEMRDYVKLEDEHRKEQKIAVIPDSFFVLTTPRGKGHFCLEMDRGTVSVSAHAANRGWKQKVRAYVQYDASGAYTERYGARSFRVLCVTTSSARLLHMLQATAAVGGQEQFWFTTFDQVVHMEKIAVPQSSTDPTVTKSIHLPVYNQALLTAPVWYKAGSSGVYSLLT